MRYLITTFFITMSITLTHAAVPGSVRVDSSRFTVQFSDNAVHTNDVVKINISDLDFGLTALAGSDGWMQVKPGRHKPVIVVLTMLKNKDRTQHVFNVFSNGVRTQGPVSVVVRLSDSNNQEVRRYTLRCTYHAINAFPGANPASLSSQQANLQQSPSLKSNAIVRYEDARQGIYPTYELNMFCTNVNIVFAKGGNRESSWENISGGGVSVSGGLKTTQTDIRRTSTKPLQVDNLVLEGDVTKANSLTLNAILTSNVRRRRAVNIELKAKKIDGGESHSIQYTNAYISRYVFPVLDKNLRDQPAREQVWIRASGTSLLSGDRLGDTADSFTVEVLQ